MILAKKTPMLMPMLYMPNIVTTEARMVMPILLAFQKSLVMPCLAQPRLAQPIPARGPAQPGKWPCRAQPRLGHGPTQPMAQTSRWSRPDRSCPAEPSAWPGQGSTSQANGPAQHMAKTGPRHCLAHYPARIGEWADTTNGPARPMVRF
jgi:hypothetical protein